MVPGFNTDFKYRGQTFHVQTEDNGIANPVVVSLLYHKGAILASRKTSYAELVGKAECVDQLKELMKSQHKALMRELIAGAYDAKIPAAAAQAGGGGSPSGAAAPAAQPPDGARPLRVQQPRIPPGGLDEAIMRYLEEHAAAAAAG
jgi:hypothetical protein